ncbi:hypothetical protein [Haliea atlantica]
MPLTKCDCCGSEYYWSWEEAFQKYGFMDGASENELWQVEEALVEAGYDVQTEEWGGHNSVIVSIKKDGKELIPHDDPKVQFGYDDPSTYLPDEVVKLLKRELA